MLMVGVLFGFSVASAASYSFQNNLSLGSTGPDVVALQTLLESKEFLTMPSGVAKGYFGNLTQASLSRFQAANGISPASGYFGPLTRSFVNSQTIVTVPTTGCQYDPSTGAIIKKYDVNTGAQICPPPTPAPSPSPAPAPSNNDEGRLTHVDTTGGTDSSVDEGDINAKVLAIRADAEDGDISINRVDVDFDLTSSTGSSNLKKYIQSVSIWLDGKKLSTQSVSDGDRDDRTTSFRFSNLKGKIKEGDSARLYVTINAINSVDDSEKGQDISVSIPRNGIRTITGDNIFDSYPSGTDLDHSFSVNEQSDGKITLTSDENENAEKTVEASDRNSTNGIEILDFDLKSKDKDNTIREITVNLDAIAATSTATSSKMINTVHLFANGKELDDASIKSGHDSVTFDDLDYLIKADKTVHFEVKADVNRIDGINFHEGDAIKTTIGSDDIDAEDSNGDDSDVSGGAEGGMVIFRTEGISLSDPSSTVSMNNLGSALPDDSIGEFTISFKINAFGDSIYVPLTSERATTTDPTLAGLYYSLEDANGARVMDGTSTAAVARISGGSIVSLGGTNYLKINDGQSATLKLSLSFDPIENGYYRAELEAVNFHSASAATPDRQSKASPEFDYDTNFVNIQ